MRIANLIIDSPTELAGAMQLTSWLNRPTVQNVVVALPGLTEAEGLRAAKRLKTYFNDCGCLWGTLAFLIVLGWCAIKGPMHSDFGVFTVALSFAISVFCAGLAKLVGLAWSRWRLEILLTGLAADDGKRRPQWL